MPKILAMFYHLAAFRPPTVPSEAGIWTETLPNKSASKIVANVKKIPQQYWDELKYMQVFTKAENKNLWIEYAIPWLMRVELPMQHTLKILHQNELRVYILCINTNE